MNSVGLGRMRDIGMEDRSRPWNRSGLSKSGLTGFTGRRVGGFGLTTTEKQDPDSRGDVEIHKFSSKIKEEEIGIQY